MVGKALPSLLAASVSLLAADLRVELQERFDQVCKSKQFMGAAS
jgi:hypothetical protein